MDYPLITENLSVSFGKLQAVADVSYKVEHGGLQAIIGPNGAGKTTLFNLIRGMLRPTSGNVYLFGLDVTRMPLYRRAYLGLGHTFQIINIFPKLTVLENILMALQSQKSMKYVFYRTMKSYDSLHRKARDILEEWGFWDMRGKEAQNLSYGQQRRLDLILSLVEEPQMLLLDEPTAGLSRHERETVCDMIQTLSREITILMIEHDMDVVFSLAKRITVLHEGRVFLDGSPEEIRNDPNVRDIYLGEEEE